MCQHAKYCGLIRMHKNHQRCTNSKEHGCCLSKTPIEKLPLYQKLKANCERLNIDLSHEKKKGIK